MTNFTAEIDSWIAKTKGAKEAIFKESAQRVVDIMQTPTAKGGNLPVDTGFLRSSLQGSINAPKTGQVKKPDGPAFRYNPQQITMSIVNAKPGDSIYFTYSAAYARHVHYGTSRMSGRPWVSLAAQQWPQIVNSVVQDLKSRIG